MSAPKVRSDWSREIAGPLLIRALGTSTSCVAPVRTSDRISGVQRQHTLDAPTGSRRAIRKHRANGERRVRGEGAPDARSGTGPHNLLLSISRRFEHVEGNAGDSVPPLVDVVGVRVLELRDGLDVKLPDEEVLVVLTPFG